MLFGYITDEHYIDVYDESGKLFRRFVSEDEYQRWAMRFTPSDLAGLVKKEITVKWYDSMTQWVKLVSLFVFVLMCVVTAMFQ